MQGLLIQWGFVFQQLQHGLYGMHGTVDGLLLPGQFDFGAAINCPHTKMLFNCLKVLVSTAQQGKRIIDGIQIQSSFRHEGPPRLLYIKFVHYPSE
ncbi:hypothetical protein SDC9_193208 [bioreactor metagenome]|uniref:Uncharacterized protein n=1 Tax=bioreactor metagenome TaxID=1076179 RepID=A0A645I3D9_9ZZZZ